MPPATPWASWPGVVSSPPPTPTATTPGASGPSTRPTPPGGSSPPPPSRRRPTPWPTRAAGPSGSPRPSGCSTGSAMPWPTPTSAPRRPPPWPGTGPSPPPGPPTCAPSSTGCGGPAAGPPPTSPSRCGWRRRPRTRSTTTRTRRTTSPGSSACSRWQPGRPQPGARRRRPVGRAPTPSPDRFGDDVEDGRPAGPAAGQRCGRRWPACSTRPGPTVSSSTAAEVDDLLGPVADDLAGAGIEVLWPAGRAGHRRPPAHRRHRDDRRRRPCGRADLRRAVRAPLGGRRSTASSSPTTSSTSWPRPSGASSACAAAGCGPTPSGWPASASAASVSAGDALAAALGGDLVVDGEAVAADGRGRRWPRWPSGSGGRPTSATSSPPADLDAELRPYQRQRRGVAGRDGRPRPRRGPGRRHGPGQDRPAPRPAPAPPATGPTPAHRWSSARSSVLANWEREAARFAPGVPVRRYHGTGRTLDDLPRRRDRARHLRRGPPRGASRSAAVAWGLVVGRRGPGDQEPACRAPPGRCAASPPTPASPSPARRSRTAWPSCGRSSTGPRPGCSARSSGSAATSPCPIERDQRPGRRRAPGPAGAAVPAAPPQDPTPTSPPTCRPRPRPTASSPLTAEQATLYRAVVDEVMDQVEDGRGHGPPRPGAQAAHRAQADLQPPGAVPQPGRPARRAARASSTPSTSCSTPSSTEGDAVLVFTQYVAMGHLLAAPPGGARPTGPSVPPRRAAPSARRQEMVDRFQAGEVARVRDLAQGRRHRAQPHPGHPRRPLRPLVEPGGRGPGHRPGLAHRPGPARAGPPAGLRGHGRGPHRRAARREARRWPTSVVDRRRGLGRPSWATTTCAALVAPGRPTTAGWA